MGADPMKLSSRVARIEDSPTVSAAVAVLNMTEATLREIVELYDGAPAGSAPQSIGGFDTAIDKARVLLIALRSSP